MALAAGQMVLPAARLLRAKARMHATYTVKVSGADAMYDDLHDWVLGLLPPGQQRALVAWTTRQGGALIAADSAGRPPEAELRLS